MNTGTVNAVAASDTGAHDRGVQRAGKRVTRDVLNGNTAQFHPMRANLVEVEFISNADALSSLTGANSDAIIDAFAENAADNIISDIEHQPEP